MKPVEYNMNFVRGNTFELNIAITDENIVIDEIYFTLKKSAYLEDSIIQKKLNNGISLENDETYTLKIEADDTENLEFNKEYGYDIKIIIGSTKLTILTGICKLEKNYTRKTNEV